MTSKKTPLETGTPLTAAARNVGRPPSKVPLMLSTSLALLGGLGYVQRAYAQTVNQGSLSTSNSETVELYGPGTFETQPDFSVDVTTGDAITITTDPGHTPSVTDATTFLDYSAGQITSSMNDAIDADVAYGSLTITTDSVVNAGRRGLNVNHGAGQGATANATNLSITAHQITAEYGIRASHLGVGDVSITVTGDILATDGKGIRSSSTNTVTTTRNIAISAENITSDDDAVSVLSRAGQDVSISVIVNGDISAGNGGYGHGVWAYAESPNDNADIDVRTYGSITSYNHGIKAYNDVSGGDITITAMGEISITGGYYHGIYARNTGDSLDVTVHGITASGYGVYARNSGAGHLIITSRGSIVGDYEGIRASQDNPSATGNIEIRVHDVAGGNYGNGIDANNNGSGNLIITSGGTITATASGYSGINATSGYGDTVINVNNVRGQEHGIYMFQGDGSVSIGVNGDVTGGDGDGIFAYNASTEDLTITISEGGSVSTGGTDTSDFAIEADAPYGAVIVNNFGTVTGRVNLTNSNTFTNSGTWNLAGTTSNFNATGDSTVVNAGLIVAAQDAAVNETSVIENLDTFRNNAGGTIWLADGNAADVFEIRGGSGTGNFIANGGTVELDVVLGDDGSAADRLDISGDVILDGAPTALAINSVGGGAGGETTTGIEVVTVAGSSDAGAFVLTGPVEVGALAYDLSLGDCTDQSDQSWYLCNNGTIGTTGAVFEAMPGIVLNSFARTETLQQRLGARVTSQELASVTASSRGEADLPVAQSVGPWMRTWGDFADITPDNSTAGTSWEADSWGLEAGVDAILGDHAGGDLVMGVSLRYSAIYADLSTPLGTASLNAAGFGLGASLTWFGNDGFYVDGNAAVDFASIDATSQGGGMLLDGDDDVVYSASIEVGQRLELQGGTTLVPQAQLSWGRMRDATLTDNVGNVVSFADRETLTSRIGLTIEQDMTGTAWGSGTIYGFGNVLHDLTGSRTTTVAGTDVTQSGTGDWVELGGGFSLQPSETTSLFGQVSYREAFDGVSGNAVALSAGLRMQW